MRDVKTMTSEELLDEGYDIIESFEDYSESDPFGWDWPTMSAVFPEKVERFRALKAEYNSRKKSAPRI